MTLKVYDKLKHAIRYWLLRRLPTCQQTVALISQSMERPLALRERVLVKLHLWICAWCLWYLEHLQLIRDSVRAKANEDPDLELSAGTTLSAEARERIKRQLAANEW
jgi:hypothetical protein